MLLINMQLNTLLLLNDNALSIVNVLSHTIEPDLMIYVEIVLSAITTNAPSQYL